MNSTLLSVAAPDHGVSACWSQTGVWGDGRCPELAAHVHCRNCPTYERAATRLLDEPLPDSFVEEWSRHFAVEKPQTTRAASPVMLFRVHKEWFALPVAAVVEVVPRRSVHVLPHARAQFIKGIVNIRGQLLICVSPTRLLNVTQRTAAEKAATTMFERMLVVASDTPPVVFPVSEVFGLWRHQPGDLREVPATVARADARFTRAVLPWRHPGVSVTAESNDDIPVGILDEQALLQFINRQLA